MVSNEFPASLDAKNAVLAFAVLLVVFTSSAADAADNGPPRTDYCQMLARDIQGKQHGFLAGHHLYYVGGAASAEWKIREHETLGFTHPMFRDGRARGHGIVSGDGGTGHDMWGWEFWRRVRTAYGTVIVAGKRFDHPRPVSMIWRPDRQECVYEVGDVTITETKFITNDDVLCAIINSDKPVTLEFAGQSYWNPGFIGTHDGDSERTPYSILSTAAGSYDRPSNSIHVREGGAIYTKPDWGKPAVEGKLMYDGMHAVLTASQSLAESHSIRRDENGVVQYKFTASCTPTKPLVLTYAIGDEFVATADKAAKALRAPEESLQAKTGSINAVLNEQIPYFRCSDKQAVKVYYYQWALYFMYFTDGEGWERYPHTQTAVNNFMGLHLWDSWVYTAMGAWVADKWRYGHGNVLAWQFMVPFKDKNGALPDNFGTKWFTPSVRMNFVGATEFAWRQYEQSGDRKYLNEVYDRVFRPLYWRRPQGSWGIEINAIDALISMANELDRADDVAHWKEMRPGLVRNFRNQWEAYLPDLYAPRGSRWKDIWQLASLMSSAMQDDWAQRMTDRWVMNAETGFLGTVPLEIRPPDTPENGPFAVSTISSWLAIEGMFRHRCSAEAVHCTLGHIRGMHREFGYPISPESWDGNSKPWGSMYYNWDGAIIPLFIERLAGIRYSIPEQTLTVRDHLPDTWDFIEIQTPIVKEGETKWAFIRIERTKEGKAVEVRNNPLEQLRVESWLEDRPLLFSHSSEKGYASLAFDNARDQKIELKLGERDREFNTLAKFSPVGRGFKDSVDVDVENLHLDGARLRYTIDGSEPNASSPLLRNSFRLTRTTTITVKAFSDDGTRFRPVSTTFRRVALLPSVERASLKPGLRYKYFNGRWKKLPDFDALKAQSTGSAKGLDVTVGETEHFAMRFSGLIEVPADAIYTFTIRSDDGSRLFIDGEKVAELNVLSGYDAWEDEGQIGLKAGLHRLNVEYFQYDKRSTLRLDYRIDGGVRKPVSKGMLKCEN